MEYASAQPQRKGFSFDGAAVLVLALTVAITGLIAIPYATVPFLATKVSVLAAGAILALALFILARLIRGNIILPPVALLGAMWLVPLAYMLSALFSGAGIADGFFGSELETDTAGFIVLAALVGSLAALTLRRRAEYATAYKVLTGAFILALVVQLAFVIVAQTSPTTVSATANLIGTFADLGAVAGLGTALSLLALRFLTPSPRVKLVLSGGILVALFLLAIVNSSLLWILTGLVALGLFIEAVMRRRPAGGDSDLEGVEIVAATPYDAGAPTVSGLGAPLAVLAVALFFLIGSSTIGTALVTGLGAETLDVRPSWQATFDIGSHTYATSPIFGSGPASFGEEWVKFRDPALNETPFWTVDFLSGVGFIPTSFVTTGAAGALAWLFFLGAFLFAGTRFLLLRAPSDPFIRFVSLASYVGALFVFALMVFAVPSAFVIALAFFLAGTFVSTMRHGAGATEWGVAFARSPRIGFVIVFALTLILLASVYGVYTVVERYLAQTYLVSASNALAAGNLGKAESDAANSTLFVPSDRSYRLESAIGLAKMRAIADPANTSPDTERQEAFQAALRDSVADGITATQIGGSDYRNWMQLANVYAYAGQFNVAEAYESAKVAFARAKELNPTSPVIPYFIAQIEIAQGNLAEAERLLIEEAIALKRNYTEARYVLSQVEVRLGKAPEALRAAEDTLVLAPNEPAVIFQVGILRLATGNIDGAIAAFGSAIAIDPSYANAHFFLAVAHATKKDYASAITELRTVGALSAENQGAVAEYIKELEAGKNPFPSTLSLTPVAEPAPGTTDAAFVPPAEETPETP
ncbi:MAG: tetratricopeptide repeat protein [Candidatus Pacebacteria bacterium]|nr:tetratricopeptide repeat protein [Candidatus Paceibacterota bacterium]MBP9840359.1 tetratricopeptide repeat protein [Candidatus Paceibacterota bacterium]